MNKYLGWKPAFISYTVSLNQLAQNGNLDPVAGRDKEIQQVIDILSRRTKNNPLIVGEAGVGKTAVIEGLAQRIVKGNVPTSMLNKEILQLDLSALVAGARQMGEVQQRLRNLIAAVKNTTNTILFIEDIHLLLDGKTAKHLNATEILKKHLDHGQLPIIGITTAEFHKEFDKDKSFEKNFQPVHITEPTDDETFLMLQIQRPHFEIFHTIRIPDETLKQTIQLAKQHVPQRFFPDKALDLLDEAAADVRIQKEKKKRRTNKLTKNDIEKIISEWMGITITELTKDESEKLLNLEKLISKKFAGQKNAVAKVSEAIRRGRIGLSATQRPIASYIFHGQSGVGKTELVKVLAEVLFGRDDAMLQLDMSEYMEKQDVSKLIGAPPGFNGYEEGGILTEAVSRKPAMIIMLDNIDKAHPDVANLLLQILDEGSVTDNKGQKINFRNTIIIGTTTLGKNLIQEKLLVVANDPNEEHADTLLEELEPVLKEELLKFLSPEVLNRFDGTVSFKPLSPKDMEKISRLLIADVASLLKKQNFILQTTEPAISELAKAGYSPQEGARPLRKIISDVIENPVAIAIISQKFNPGDTILVEFINNRGFSISNSSKQILEYTKVKLPNIRDIAVYETAFVTNESARIQEVDNLIALLKKLARMETVIDPVERATLEAIQKQLAEEKTKGNPVADVILTAIQSLKGGKPAPLPAHQINGIQLVSEEDFEAVKTIWLENYLNLRTLGNSLETQIDWIKNEQETAEHMIKLIRSEKTEDNEAAVKHVVSILPFLLIGGFTRDEIISYLEAKSEAAKLALETLHEEEDSLVSVLKPTKSAEKSMQAPL